MKVDFGEIGVEGRGEAARRVWGGDEAAVCIGNVGPCPIGPTGGVEEVLEFGKESLFVVGVWCRLGHPGGVRPFRWGPRCRDRLGCELRCVFRQ